MKNIETAFSVKPSVDEAVTELKARLRPLGAKLVLFFASSSYDPAPLAQAMERAFSPATVFGCTTAGEIISGKMLKNSVVAMAFSPQVIQDVKVEILTHIRQDASAAAVRACADLESYYGMPLLQLDETRHVGIILVDGLSGAEEALMEKLGDLTNLQFVGGSAGDDLKFTQTYIFANGQAYTEAALLAVLKPVGEFDFIKTESFKPMPQVLVPTKVNPTGREVIEFDGQPAAEAYAASLGIPPDKLADSFMTHPVGLMVGAEPYVRSPQRVEGQSIHFFCAVKEGVELRVLESTDIIRDTHQALAAKLAQAGQIQGLVNFHCILRTLELEKKGQTEAYGQLFTEIPAIGFSTYGEEFLGHMNQTSTILVLK